MSDINLTELFANLGSSITIPTSFHSQCSAVKKMLKSDSTGLINSLLQFQINAASVNFSIETDSPELSKILNKFLDDINLSFGGKIPSGINTIAKEYFTERWSASSLPVLKIAKWENIASLELPSKMFIVDGSSIYAKDKDKKSEKSLLQYDYFLGKKMEHKLDKNVIFNRPFSRLWEKYTNLYLIRTGIYHNFEILASLKNKQGKILNQVIDYLFLIKRGSEILNRENYVEKDEDYTKILNQYGEIMKKAKNNSGVPARVTSFDEKVEHLMPDLLKIMEPKLFTVGEKAILGGFGFLDIAESVSSSRKESVLNPKPFVEEIKAGVNGFKEILRGVLNLIKQKNEKNTKYMNSTFRIVSSPITAFINSEFKNHMRLTWERGQLSNQTYCELVGEVEFATEVARREKEAKDGIEFTMYPHLTQNMEQYETYEEVEHRENFPEKKNKKIEDKNGKPIPPDKLDDPEKYKNAKKEEDLIGSPYRTIKSLPDNVKKKLSPAKQRIWMEIFNKAYNFMFKKTRNKKRADTYAFSTAWSQIKQVKSKKKGE